MRPLVLAALGLTLGVSTPAFAQKAGTFDLGAHVRYSILDDDLQTDNGIGFGGRLGIFLRNNLALEFEHDRFSGDATGGDVKMQPFYLRLAYHRPMGDRWAGILGAGWVRDRTSTPGGDLYSDDGYSLDAGLQLNMNQTWGLRADVIGDALMSPLGERPGADLRTGNIHINLGLNLRFGGGPGDSDKDGVTDNLDACPGTPAGETVDGRGCVPPKDADRDGVIDANDRCANTPAGTRVNATGCPLDTDGDGVTDASDRCANTPAGTRVDATGCPVPVDTDRDGVMDNVDACANTPANTRVDARGCPVPVDTDGDSVMDNVDACPGTAAGVRVDARGCAIVFEEGRTNIVLEGVTFATGKADLTPGAMAILDKVAESLVNAKDVNVEVAGYTDNTGMRAANVRLSGARAESVRAYLVSKGVAASRLSARGYGPEAPVATNTTAAGRQQNRRVELKRTN